MDKLANLLRHRSSEVKGTNNQKLDFVYFDLKVPAFGGQDFSLTTQFMDTFHPMLDGENVQYAINLSPQIRIRNILLFGVLQRLRPELRWIATDNGLPTIPPIGINTWLRVLRLRRYMQAAMRKGRTALFGSSGEGTDQSDGIKRLRTLGYFDLLKPLSPALSSFVSTSKLAEFKNSPDKQPNQYYLIGTLSVELFFQRVRSLREDARRIAAANPIPCVSAAS